MNERKAIRLIELILRIVSEKNAAEKKRADVKNEVNAINQLTDEYVKHLDSYQYKLFNKYNKNK